MWTPWPMRWPPPCMAPPTGRRAEPYPRGPTHAALLARWELHHTDEELVYLAHHRDELLEVDRLGHVGVGVQLVAAQDVLVRLGCGEHHHRNLAQLLVRLDFLEHLPAVAAGQVEVQQHQVGPHGVGEPALAAEVGERLLTI